MRRDRTLYATGPDLADGFHLERATSNGQEIDRPTAPIRFAAPLPGTPTSPHLVVDVTMSKDHVLYVEYDHGTTEDRPSPTGSPIT